MTIDRMAVLMGDPPARHLAYADVVEQREQAMTELRKRVRREGMSREEVMRLMWNEGHSLGTIGEATGAPLSEIYDAVRGSSSR